MKILLVTSDITYIPENYLEVFESLFEQQAKNIAGLVVLKSNKLEILKTAAGVYALGAPRLASQLLKNLIQLPLRKREELCEKYNIPFLQRNTVNDVEFIEYVKQNQIDLIINMRTRCIYKTEILNAPRLGCVNVHHGILPEYRGTMCDLYALSEGRPAGFSIHKMKEKIDAGEIYHREAVSDGSNKDYVAHLRRASRVEARALAQFIETVAQHSVLPVGMQNLSSNVVMSKTPKTRQEIQAILSTGVIL